MVGHISGTGAYASFACGRVHALPWSGPGVSGQSRTFWPFVDCLSAGLLEDEGEMKVPPSTIFRSCDWQQCSACLAGDMYDTCILHVDVNLVASKSNSYHPSNHGRLNRESSVRSISTAFFGSIVFQALAARGCLSPVYHSLFLSRTL